MTTAFTIVGLALILVAIQDIFHTLFHPARHGDVADWIARSIWRGFRTFMPRALSFAGPLAFVVVFAYWTVSIIFGFALIYMPHLPNAFTFASGLIPQSYRSFLGALDVSMATLITLSTGVYSADTWMQFGMAVESVFGLGLLTASVSWILSIYPVFEHRKSLAHEASLLHFSEINGIRRLNDISDSDLQQILMRMASLLITSRNELSQFPITYYFHEDESKTSLAGILPYLSDIAEQNARRNGAAGLAATMLGGAVDDYLRLVARNFLHREFTNRQDILRAFAEDHMRQVVRSPQRALNAA